ncbi:MAG TPA: tetratricopeptide repeat protein [Vicinamibacteria bacterium]|nr:tetratricopeptide repeat protein [Vicinamibacteria bacterium]
MRRASVLVGLMAVLPTQAQTTAATGRDVRHERVRRQLADKHDAEALAELREAAAAGALPRDLALALARLELAAGHLEPAEQQLRYAAERFGSVQALLQLARLDASRRDTGAALETLRRALEIAPNSEEVLSLQAQVALAGRSPVPAIRALEPLTRMCASVAHYHYLQGVSWMQLGDMPTAIESLREADRLEPSRPLTLIGLGLALNNRKLHDEARTALRRALELEPDNLEAIAALAEANAGLGELQEAEALALRVLERDGSHATANLVMGMVRMKQERHAEARVALEKAAEGDPASSKVHYLLSLACARLGDQVASEAHLELYKKRLKEIEERVTQLRNETRPAGGMQR